MSVINYTELEKHLKYIEKYFENQDINIEEQKIILDNIHQRNLKKIQKQRTNDTIGELDFGNIINRVMGSQK